MVNVSGNIFASDYNSIRSTVDQILNAQWGQPLVSNTVIASVNTVSAQQLQDLYIDLQIVHVHQNGTLNELVAVPQTGFRIGADTVVDYNDVTGATTAVTGGNQMGVNDYSDAASTISNFNPELTGFPVANLLPTGSTTSQRTTTWGGAGQVQQLYHVVTITFASGEQADYFFNAGGELRVSANVVDGSGAKTNDWRNLLTALGTVKFNKFNTTGDSGVGTSVGYANLTGVYQQLFLKVGSGVYADNDYKIEGQKASPTVLRFRITFNDGDTGQTGGTAPLFINNPIDEQVNGTLTSNIQSARPASNFTYNSQSYGVDLDSPVISNIATVDVNYGAVPS